MSSAADCEEQTGAHTKKKRRKKKHLRDIENALVMMVANRRNTANKSPFTFCLILLPTAFSAAQAQECMTHTDTHDKQKITTNDDSNKRAVFYCLPVGMLCVINTDYYRSS